MANYYSTDDSAFGIQRKQSYIASIGRQYKIGNNKIHIFLCKLCWLKEKSKWIDTRRNIKNQRCKSKHCFDCWREANEKRWGEDELPINHIIGKFN